jgi:hypothetical protein
MTTLVKLNTNDIRNIVSFINAVKEKIICYNPVGLLNAVLNIKILKLN